MIITFYPALLSAETFYVAPSGDDRNPGTLEEPFAGLSFAAGTLDPGSVVIAQAGTYLGPVQIDVEGTKERPIVLRAAEGASVVIDGTGTLLGTDLVSIVGDYIVFEGFEVTNAQHVGISLWGTTGVVVRHNTVHGGQDSGIWVGFDQRLVSRQNVIEENIVYENAMQNSRRTMETGWPSGIEISGSDDAVVRGNRIFRNYGEAISVLSSKNTWVVGNLVYDSYSVNIYLDNAQNVTVDNNTSGTSNDSEFYRNDRPAFGAVIADKEAPFLLPSRNNKIINNLFIGVRGVVVDPVLGTDEGIASHVISPNQVRRGVIQLE